MGMRSPLATKNHEHMNQGATLGMAQKAPSGANRRPGRAAITVMAGLVAASALLAGAPAQADAGADVALIAALDGAPVPLPARKPTLGNMTAAIPLPPPVPPQRLANPGLAFVTDAGVTVGGPVADALTLASSASARPDTEITQTAQTVTGDAFTPAPVEVAARVDQGDTLIGLLIEAGVDRLEAHKAIQAMRDVYDPRRMRPGHVVNIRFSEPDNESLRFLGFDFEPKTGTRVMVTPEDDGETGFSAQEMQEPLVSEVVRFSGPITLSLYQAAVDAGVSEAALAEMIRILSYDVDFQRDIQKDDTFEIMYETFSTADGRHVRDGSVQFLALTNAGKRIAAYAFETEDGFVEYFDEQGKGVRKPLMRTPIDGARLSSSFGMRRHPILGYSKMHTGVDFAAPTGTPIYAAGDGIVRYAGRKGGYGNYVQIRHNGEFATAYAHMSRILVRNGARVHQGDVIGRVGTTGRSTGPHLHYEIIRNGQKVNPMGVRFPPATILAGAEMERFQAHQAEVDRLYASLRSQTEVASTGAPSP